MLMAAVSITGDCMAKTSDPYHALTTHRNCGKHKLGVGVLCDRCAQPLAGVKKYVVHAYRTAVMPARAFDYFHVGCAKQVFKQGD